VRREEGGAGRRWRGLQDGSGLVRAGGSPRDPIKVDRTKRDAPARSLAQLG
jgi:hypothetical protein